jgi:hypothetical protein
VKRNGRRGDRRQQAPLTARLVARRELEDVAAVHAVLIDVDAALAELDPLRKDVDAVIVAVEHELDEPRPRRVAADRARRALGEHVAHQALVAVRRGEHPVVVGGQPQQPRVTAIQLERVLLLGEQRARRVRPVRSSPELLRVSLRSSRGTRSIGVKRELWKPGRTATRRRSQASGSGMKQRSVKKNNGSRTVRSCAAFSTERMRLFKPGTLHNFGQCVPGRAWRTILNRWSCETNIGTRCICWGSSGLGSRQALIAWLSVWA